MVYINENPKGGLQFQAWLDPEAQMSFSLYTCPPLPVYLLNS